MTKCTRLMKGLWPSSRARNDLISAPISRIGLRMLGFVLGGALFSPMAARAQECEGWFSVSGDTPTGRVLAVLAYDDRRDLSILYGGWSWTWYQGARDTWLWDGTSWLLYSDVFPGTADRRSGPAGAFDSVRGEVIFHGGHRDPNPNYADTWGFGDGGWTQLSDSEPSARWFHAMAFDSARGVAVLFGGTSTANHTETATTLGDTWEWDGSHWTLAATGGPPPRMAHVMAYDPGRGVVVLFGGSDNWDGRANYYGDTWEWNGVSWTQAATDGPPVGSQHTFTYDPNRHALILYGGFNGTDSFSDTWEYDGTWRQLDVVGGTRCVAANSTFDAGRNRIVLFGGSRRGHDQSYYVCRETWEFNGSTWTEVGPPNISQLNGMAYDTVRNELVVVGTVKPFQTENGNPRTWLFRDGRWRSAPVTPIPFRTSAAMAFDSARGRTVLFGANSDQRTYEWDGENWSIAAESGPPRNGNVTMDYDPLLGVCVLYNISLRETWLWDGATWTQEQGPAPTNTGITMAYDAARGVSVLYTNAGVWEHDSEGWHQRSLRSDPTTGFMFYHGGLQQVVRLVKESSDAPWILRAWDGAAWTTHALPSGGPALQQMLFGAIWNPSEETIFAIKSAGQISYDRAESEALLRVGTFGRAGDCNCDGQVNNFDIDTFVAALSGDVFEYHLAGGSLSCWRARSCWADANQDGLVNNFDIDAFVALLEE